MNIKIAVCVASLFLPSLSIAKTYDWTPYLKGIQANCQTPDLDKPIPMNLKPSIIQMENHRKLDDGTYVGKKVFKLKNANLFGYPLTKISMDSNGYEGETLFYFADTKFMALRNQFYADTNKGKLYASEKRKILDPDSITGEHSANGTGYSSGAIGLDFNEKTKSISCGWSAD